MLLNELDISMTGQEITGIVLEQLNNDKAIKAKGLEPQSPSNQKKKKGETPDDGGEYEEDRYKNIQRRVYDTINVLIALDIVHKNKNRLWYNIKNTLFFENDTSLRMTKLSNIKNKTQDEIHLYQKKLNEIINNNSNSSSNLECTKQLLLNDLKKHICMKKLT